MSTQNDGGPAFPITKKGCYTSDGMTLRDYFAAKAMQSLLRTWADNESGWPYCNDKETARLAYEAADAMIEQRNK